MIAVHSKLVTMDPVAFLADKGYDPQYGARPVKRAIQDYVLNELSKQLLSGAVTREKAIVVKYEANASQLKIEN